jgi:predicted transcriptional regulator
MLPYMEKTTLYLPDEMQRSLAIVAKRERRSQAAVIREAIAAFLESRGSVKLRSIGVGSDDEVTGANSEDWLRKNWRKRAKPSR